jgi:hypothetical protein
MTTINGKVVDKKDFQVNYDGKNMIIRGHNNNKTFKKKLSKNDILKLLAKPANKHTLNQRLIKDFGMMTSRHKKTKRNNKSKQK